jgi:chaperonin GroES
MALNIKPLSDRVLIEPVAAETKNASGILFQIQQKKTTKKELSLLLETEQKNTLTVKIGDSVGKYAGTELKLEGKII